MSLQKSYHSADATKRKILVFKGVSTNVTINDFREVLDHNKIAHAEAERMKSERTGRDLPFIKIKCDNLKQSEALISGGLVCQKTGIIFKVEDFRTTPSIQQFLSAKVLGTRHRTVQKNQKVLCVVKLTLQKLS